MARKQQFTAPAENPYTAPAQPAEPQKTDKKDEYRFNAKMPAICGTFLQEMAWRKSLEEHKRVTITEYLIRLVTADMEAHPEWKETVDVLNISKK